MSNSSSIESSETNSDIEETIDRQIPSLQELQDILKDVYNQYNETITSNDISSLASLYSLERLSQTINQLPIQMEQWYTTHQQREKRKNELERIQEEFIQSFLVHPSKQYYYIPRTGLFIVYDGYHTQVVDEDTIWHDILSILSKQEHPLFTRRYSVKISIMHRIKQRSILGITPSSYTIQYILDFLVPTFLNNKSSGKYFLCVLGDMMLKKNNNIFLLDSKSKNFIDSLERLVYFYWSGSIHVNEGFKFKYYEHNYEQCRLIQFNDTIQKEQLWNPFIKSYILDLIIVATHYSTRFNSSDEYLRTKCIDDGVKDYAFFLKERSERQLVDKFIENYIEKTDNNDITISWRQIIYLWKQYLNDKGLPAVMILSKLREQLIYNGLNFENDVFKGVSSIYLQTVQDFERFWSEWIVVDESEHIETSEMLIGYSQWSKLQKSLGRNVSKLGEDKIVSFITHFHPNFHIDNRMIFGVRCNQWRRKEELQYTWETLKTKFKEEERKNAIHWSEVYEFISSILNSRESNTPIPNTRYVYQWMLHNDILTKNTDWIDSGHWS